MLTKSKEKVNGFYIHISGGKNRKTHIPSFNLPAGDKNKPYNGCIPAVIKDYILGSGCTGSCSGDCPGCYDKKSTRYPGAMLSRFDNFMSLLIDIESVFTALENMLYSHGKKPDQFRIHDGGDFFSYDYFCAWVDFAKKHPETQFGCYTKEREIVLQYGIDNLPKNFSLQCSPWPGHCDPIGDLPQFWYDDFTNPDLEKVPHCPAVDRNGKRTGITCDKCKHCYNAKRGQVWAVYKH